MKQDKNFLLKRRRIETVQVSIRPKADAVEFIKKYLQNSKSELHPSTAMARIVEAWVEERKDSKRA